MTTLLALVPFDPTTTFRAVEVGSGEGRLMEAILSRFPLATGLALDASESMRAAAGFTTVDCFWMYAGHAVYGGFR
jgi:trans-aconitate methyltransferase